MRVRVVADCSALRCCCWLNEKFNIYLMLFISRAHKMTIYRLIITTISPDWLILFFSVYSVSIVKNIQFSFDFPFLCVCLAICLAWKSSVDTSNLFGAATVRDIDFGDCFFLRCHRDYSQQSTGDEYFRRTDRRVTQWATTKWKKIVFVDEIVSSHVRADSDANDRFFVLCELCMR